MGDASAGEKNVTTPQSLRRVILAVLGCALPALALAACGPPDQPNFIVVLTDDQGYGDTGRYGAEGFATPSLDRMANASRRLIFIPPDYALGQLRHDIH